MREHVSAYRYMLSALRIDLRVFVGDTGWATLVNVLWALAAMRIPVGETVVEVPRRLMKFVPPRI